MKVMGMYWGICSTAALLMDRHLAAAVSEERFTRVKNDDVFPAQAIRWCLDSQGLKPQELDGVSIAAFVQGYDYTLLRVGRFTIDDYLLEQRSFWKPSLLEGKQVSRLDVMRHCVDMDQYPSEYWKHTFESSQRDNFDSDREMIVANFLEIDPSKVRRIDHHRCHAAYGYFTSPFVGQEALVLTVDGWGDDCNATINIVRANGVVENKKKIINCNIGRIYRYVTLLLGMKPNEHEYKVMGLAPYAKGRVIDKPYKVFSETLSVDGLGFKWKTKPGDSYFWFKDRLEGCRFDGIAAGLQLWVEDLLTEWVSHAVRYYGIRNVVLSGGVAMNVKAMGKIGALPEVDRLFVGGSSADESLALAAPICLAQDLAQERGEKWVADGRAIPSLYLGPNGDGLEETAFLRTVVDKKVFDIIASPTADDIAALLAGERYGRKIVIARCAGRTEFGQRALCNRSILADPIETAVIPRINYMIKNRDFWMPFAPVVMDRYVGRYLVNPKGHESPHMTLGFETTDEGWRAMPAGCHQADRSCRPQILKKEDNPPMYDILEAFERRTGRGALLNTSFNLHGYPIVNTVADAWDVFVRSGLDALLLNTHLVIKKQAS